MVVDLPHLETLNRNNIIITVYYTDPGPYPQYFEIISPIDDKNYGQRNFSITYILRNTYQVYFIGFIEIFRNF